MSPVISLRPIGVIRTPHQEPDQTPIQPCFARGVRGEIHLDPRLEEGLKGLLEFSHIHLIYHLHRQDGERLTVLPFMIDEPKGIFACRHPARPNALGLSLVKLLGVEGCRIQVEDVDMLDGTPLLDLKPCYPPADFPEGAGLGWLERVDPAEAERRGARQQAGAPLVPSGSYRFGEGLPSLPLS